MLVNMSVPEGNFIVKSFDGSKERLFIEIDEWEDINESESIPTGGCVHFRNIQYHEVCSFDASNKTICFIKADSKICINYCDGRLKVDLYKLSDSSWDLLGQFLQETEEEAKNWKKKGYYIEKIMKKVVLFTMERKGDNITVSGDHIPSIFKDKSLTISSEEKNGNVYETTILASHRSDQERLIMKLKMDDFYMATSGKFYYFNPQLYVKIGSFILM